MIKKISAIVLALVLCLSVVVVPTSALDLGDKGVAFELKWDKDAYSAGETATLSIFMKVSEDYEIGTGSLLIGLNSAVINQTDNDAADIKDSMVASDLWTSFWKVPSNSAAWLASTVASKVTTANTAEEQALYDHYFKITISRDTSGSGSHENSTDLKRGLPGADFNALADAGEPILQLSFVVADGVADGTAINAGITSGSASCSPAQTAFKYIKTPGSASTTANVPAASFGTAIATATVGEATIVNPLKGQMRYGATAGTYDVRALAVITGEDFTATFGSIADAKTKIKDIGFVFASGSNITAPSMEAVAALVEEGTAITGYKKVPISQISTAISTGNYVFSCIVTDIPAEAAQSDKLIAIGYVGWDSDADGVVDSYNYYTEAQTINFADYYKA